jgi:hypothetical protein
LKRQEAQGAAANYTWRTHGYLRTIADGGDGLGGDDEEYLFEDDRPPMRKAQ